MRQPYAYVTNQSTLKNLACVKHNAKTSQYLDREHRRIRIQY